MSGCSLWVFCGAKTSIKTSMRWSVFFYLSSKRNRKFKHLVQTKPMGENTITNIMKVSVAGTSLKESEKKVYESLCKKNNSQEADESKDCKFRTYRQCHRPQRTYQMRACPTGSCSFVGLWKIYSCLFIPNCTRNNVITYTNTCGFFSSCVVFFRAPHGREKDEQWAKCPLVLYAKPSNTRFIQKKLLFYNWLLFFW